MDNKDKNIEHKLSQLLTSDEHGRGKADQEALQMLAPKYEIRIQAEQDPIVEETKQFRHIAKEVDDRYDRFVARNEKEQSGDEV